MNYAVSKLGRTLGEACNAENFPYLGQYMLAINYKEELSELKTQ